MSRSLLLSSVAGAALVAALVGAPSSASAQINLGGYTGPVHIKYNNYESIVNSAGKTTSNFAVGDTLFGVLSVTTISSIGGVSKQLYDAGSAGNPFLLGVFTGPTITAISPTGTLSFAFTSKNPVTVDIYSSATQLDPTQGLGGYTTGGCGGVDTLCYNGVSNGGNVLQLALTSAANILGEQASGSFVVTAGGQVSSGSASFLANVEGGAAATQFNTNGVTDPGLANVDMSVLDNFCTNGAAMSPPDPGAACGFVSTSNGSAPFFSLSQDPVLANVIPEPNALALLGGMFGLLGLFGMRRRKRQ